MKRWSLKTLAEDSGLESEKVNALFTNAEVAKNNVQNIFDVDASSQPAEGPPGESQFLGDDILASWRRLAQGSVESAQRALQGVAVAGPRHQGGLGRAKVFPRILAERSQESIES